MALSVQRRQLAMMGGALVVVLLLFLLLSGRAAAAAAGRAGASPGPAAGRGGAGPGRGRPRRRRTLSQLRLAGMLATSGAIIGIGRRRSAVRPGRTRRPSRPDVAAGRAASRDPRLGRRRGSARLRRCRPERGRAGRPPPRPSARDETLRYRLGLAPRRAGGRIAGFTVRPGAEHAGARTRRASGRAT